MSTEIAPKQAAFDNIRAFFLQHKDQLAMAAPKFMTPARLIRVALTAVSMTPRLMECTPASLMGALLQCAQLGLEPGILGQAYLVPFKNSRINRYEVQLIPGYKGLITLARRSGEISTIMAQVVYEKDKFAYKLGSNPDITHTPFDGDERGAITYFYAVAKLKDGGIQFDVLSKARVDAHRDRYSKAASDGPWKTDYDAMGLKTVLRRLCKLLPASVELHTAITLDEYAEAQLPQGLSVLAGEVPEEHNGDETVHPQPEEKQQGLKDKLKDRATKTIPAEAPKTIQPPSLVELDAILQAAKTRDGLMDEWKAWSNKYADLAEDIYSEGGARMNHRYKELPT